MEEHLATAPRPAMKREMPRFAPIVLTGAGLALTVAIVGLVVYGIFQYLADPSRDQRPVESYVRGRIADSTGAPH